MAIGLENAPCDLALDVFFPSLNLTILTRYGFFPKKQSESLRVPHGSTYSYRMDAHLGSESWIQASRSAAVISFVISCQAGQ